MPRNKEPDPVDVIVGQNVRRLRTAAGMSQGQLGEHLDVTFQQVQKYEKGTNRIASSKLSRITSVLKTDLKTLFEGTDNPDIVDVVARGSLSRDALEAARLMDQLPNLRAKKAVLNLLRSVVDAEEDSEF